jgi:tetratricopeptide (TPR) repeat protein
MPKAEAKPLPDFDKLWNFNNPAETERKFNELLPDAKNSSDKDYYLQLLTQIARTKGLQRKFDDAHKTLDEVKIQLIPETRKAEVRYYVERGRVFNSAKKSEEALPLFTKAWDLAVSRGMDNLAVDAAHMIAIAEPKPEKQLEWNLKAMGVAEKSKDEAARGWLGSLYNNMGWTYHDSGKFDQALDMFQKALAFRETKAEPSSIRVAKWSIARTFRSMKKHDDALKIQTALEIELEKTGEKDGYICEELAELYLVTGKHDLSKRYFAMAFQELSKDEWFKANESLRLQRLKDLGEVP